MFTWTRDPYILLCPICYISDTFHHTMTFLSFFFFKLQLLRTALCHSTHVEVIEQHVEVDSFLLPCKSQRLYSGQDGKKCLFIPERGGTKKKSIQTQVDELIICGGLSGGTVNWKWVYPVNYLNTLKVSTLLKTLTYSTDSSRDDLDVSRKNWASEISVKDQHGRVSL